MPRNGSGTYAPPSNSVNPAVSGTTISSTDFNTMLSDVSAALTASIANDGQTTATAAIPFNAGITIPNTASALIGDQTTAPSAHTFLGISYAGNSSQAISNTLTGISSSIKQTAATTGAIRPILGWASANHTTGNISNFTPIESFTEVINAGNVTTVNGFSTNCFLTNNGNVTTYRGVSSAITLATGSGTIATAIHFRGGVMPASVTTKVGIGIDDTAAHNYLGGTFAIGCVTTTPASGVAADFQSTTGGLAVPRVTTTQRDAFAAAPDGMLIYNTTLAKFQGRASGAWGNITLT